MQLYLHMEKRSFWISKVENAWKRRNIVWLAGVRRSGKTTLARSLENVEYFDCELPHTRRLLEDPETFLSTLKHQRIVLDEIHRLSNPSEILKIAADHFPKIKVLATGSSTLEASFKFRDALTGRKEQVWLTPMNEADLEIFRPHDLVHRLQKGGLPPFFLSQEIRGAEYQEWMDSYWSRDIQELFRLEKRYSFQKFLELLFIRSGGLFEATSYSTPCEVSRTTIGNYLSVLEATHLVHIIRPFSQRKSAEIISIPKIYTFDTGFVSYYRGWERLRHEDLGILWEHYILNELQSQFPLSSLHYWRDKQKHEVDFIFFRRGKPPVAIECKWSEQNIDPAPFYYFRRLYPEGQNWVVCHNIKKSFFQRERNLLIEVLSLKDLIQKVLIL